MNSTQDPPGSSASAPPPPPPQSPSSDQPSSPPRLHRFFAGVRGIGLTRSRQRVVGGVCGGIADRTGIDPTLVRVIAVVLAIFGGIGALIYGLAWLFLPEPDGRIHAEETLRGHVEPGAIGAIVLSLVSLGGPGGGWGHWGFGLGWHSGLIGLLWGLTGTAVVLALIVLVVYAVVRGRGHGSSPSATNAASYSAYPSPAPGQLWTPATPATPAAPATPPHPAPSPGPSTETATMNTDSPPTTAGTLATLPTGPTEPAYGAAAPAPPPPDPAWSASGPLLFGPTAPVAAPTTPGRSRRASLGAYSALIAGLAFVGAAAAALIATNGDYRVSATALAWAVGLGVIALALVIGGLFGRRSGVLTLFALIALFGTLAASVIPKAAHMQAVGERTWRPVTVQNATGGYALGVGHGILDLTSIDLPRTGFDPTTAPDSTAGALAGDPEVVSIKVGIGELTVRVPAGLSVQIRTAATAGSLPTPSIGDVSLSDETRVSGGAFAGSDDDNNLGGIGIKRTVTVGTGPVQLIVDAKVGVGEIDIEQVNS